jgi:hypothetical protein
MFRPMARSVMPLGLTTDRALAMAFERVVALGVGDAVRWMVAAIAPLAGAQQVSLALDVLGHADLASFQRTIPTLVPSGRLDHASYLALLTALREDGRVPLPRAVDGQARLLHAADEPARVQLRRLADVTTFDDRERVEA